MPLELAVAAGAFLIVFVLLSPLLKRNGPTQPKDGLERARRFVDRAIEQHLGRLGAAYRECGGAEDSGAFAREIESFIGSVLVPALASAEHVDADLRDDVRELLVLDRESIYRQVRARIEDRLAQESG